MRSIFHAVFLEHERFFTTSEAPECLCRPLAVTRGVCLLKVIKSLLKTHFILHSQSKKLQLEESRLDELVLGTPRLSSWRQRQTFITTNPMIKRCTCVSDGDYLKRSGTKGEKSSLGGDNWDKEAAEMFDTEIYIEENRLQAVFYSSKWLLLWQKGVSLLCNSPLMQIIISSKDIYYAMI